MSEVSHSEIDINTLDKGKSSEGNAQLAPRESMWGVVKRVITGNTTSRDQRPETNNRRQPSRRDFLGYLAKGTTAFGVGTMLENPLANVIVSPFLPNEGSGGTPMNESGPTVEEEEGEFLSRLAIILRTEEEQLAREWAQANNIHTQGGSPVERMRNYFRSRLNQSSELLHNAFYQRLITLHATYNLIGANDGGEGPVTFETENSAEIRAFVRSIQQEPLTNIDAVIRHTYLYYIISEFSYRLEGIRGETTPDGKFLFYAGDADPLEVQMAFDMLSGFYDNQIERMQMTDNPDYVQNGQLTERGRIRGLLGALGASEGFRTAADGYINGNTLSHFRRLSENFSRLTATGFDGKRSIDQVYAAEQYFFIERPETIEGFRGSAYRPVDDFKFGPERPRAWEILNEKRSEGLYQFTDAELAELECGERQPDVLYFSFVRNEVHVFHSGSNLPSEDLETRRRNIESQYGYTFPLLCKKWLYHDLRELNSYYESGLFPTPATDQERQQRMERLAKMESTALLRLLSPSELQHAIDEAIRTQSEVDQEQNRLIERLENVGYGANTSKMWHLHRIFRQLGFIHPVTSSSVNELNTLSDQELRQRFVRENNTASDECIFVAQAHELVEEAHNQNQERNFAYLPFNFMDFQVMLDLQSQTSPFRVLRKSMLYAGFEMEEELPAVMSFGISFESNQIRLYVKSQNNELLEYAITDDGIEQVENTTFSSLPDSSYIFYNGSN